MRNRFVLPNILTTFGLSCGLFVIFWMCMIAPGAVVVDQIRSALMIILLAAFIDTLDGALARAMKVESEFGGFFDSMSDAVTFGVAPAVLTLKALSPQSDSLLGLMVYIGVMVFAVAGVLRLVRYSTMALTPQDSQKGVFVGLPITSSAVALAALTVLVLSFVGENGFISQNMAQMILIAASLFLGYLMISRWRFPSLKALHVKYTSAQLLIFAACITPVVLFLLLNNLVLTCVLFSWGYILLSWLKALYHLLRGRREMALVGRDESRDESIEEPKN